MASLTVENYLKAIWQLTSAAKGEPAATGQIAATLAVSPGTVTSMLKTLGESGLARYTPYEGVVLTPAGVGLALRVLRRHRLIELFLVKTLALSWDEVHDEAEHMEHAVSDLLIDRIDTFLGHPDVDPHGDPIPKADGTLRMLDTRALSECPSGFVFRLARVLDQTPEFLRFLTDSALALGDVGSVEANHPAAGTITIRVKEASTTLGQAGAEKIHVAAAGASRE